MHLLLCRRLSPKIRSRVFHTDRISGRLKETAEHQEKSTNTLWYLVKNKYIILKGKRSDKIDYVNINYLQKHFLQHL